MKKLSVSAVLVLAFCSLSAQPVVTTNFPRFLDVGSSHTDTQIRANTSDFNLRIDSIPDFIAISNFKLQNKAGVLGTPGTTDGGTGTSLLEDMRGLAPYATGTFFTDGNKLRWLNGDSFVTQTRYVSSGSSFVGIEQIDLPGSLYNGTSLGVVIADADLHRFLITDLNGNVLDSIGSGVSGNRDGNFETAQFMAPGYITENNQSSHVIYVTDTLAHTVKAINIQSRTVTTIVEGVGYVDGDRDIAKFDTPMGIVASLSGGELYVSDAGNHAIRKIDFQSGEVTTVAGGNGAGFTDGLSSLSMLNRPRGIDIDFKGNLIFSDIENHAVRQLTIPDHEVVTLVGDGFSGPGVNNARDYQSQLSAPKDVKFMVNRNSSFVFYIADQGNNLIKRISNEKFIRNVRSTNAGDIGYHKIAFTLYNNDGQDNVNYFLSVKSGDIPTINVDQIFSFPENEIAGTVIGQVGVNNPNSAPLSNWEVVEGNPDLDNNSTPTFSIDANGQISVNEEDGYDFEVSPGNWELFVTVSDGTYFAPPTPVKLELVNIPPTITSGQSVTVDEHSTGVIGTPQVVNEPLQVLQNWTIVSGNIDNDNDNLEAFSIDPNTGEISAADSDDLDFENVTSFSLGLSVEDGDSISAVETYVVNLNNINDMAPVVPSGQVFTADEGILGTLGDIVVTDPDGDPIVSGTYSLYLNDKNEPIEFDPDGDGQLMIAVFPSLKAPNYPVNLSVTDADDFDYEIEPTIRVVVSFGDGQFITQDTVTINLNNLNDKLPVIAPSQSLTIAENSLLGSTVGIPSVSDADGVTTFSSWSIVSGNDDLDEDNIPPFEINSTTGEITVADSDDLDAENTQVFNLELTVSDGVNTSLNETIEIAITDVNEFSPVFSMISNFSIDESLDLTIGESVGFVSATDEDLETEITYQILASNFVDPDDDGNLPLAINSTTGEITINDLDDMDFELLDSVLIIPFHFFNVIASDGSLETTSSLLQLVVNNKNDQAPIISSSQAFNIDENAENQLLVGQVEADGRDAGLITDFQNWSITSGNTDSDNDGIPPFSIVDNDDDNKGDLIVSDADDLDFETIENFNLSIVVNDGGLTSASGLDSEPEIVVVLLNNLNDNEPVVNSANFNINENSANHAVIGTIATTDPDGSTTLAFEISKVISPSDLDVNGNGEAPFSISATGQIIIEDSSDFNSELVERFEFEVRASDGTFTSEPAVVSIDVADVNEFVPEVTSVAFFLSENEEEGFSLGTLSATDGDVNQSFNDWKIVSGNPDEDGDAVHAFGISATTGELSLIDPDDLVSTMVSLVVTVSDESKTSEGKTILVSVNKSPVLIGSQSPVLLNPNESFEILLDDLFEDPNGDSLFVGATLVDQIELPNWMTYDSAQVKLSGQAPEFSESTSFEISVTAQDSMGLAVSTNFEITVNTILLGIQASFDMKVYPNPITESVSIAFDTKEEVRIKIHDELGKTVWEIEGVFSEVHADMQSLSPGIYFLSVHRTAKNNVYTHKLIKN